MVYFFDMMISRTNLIISTMMFVMLCAVTPTSFATHISQPVLIDPQNQYLIGQTIALHGRVDYNDKPAADVLLNFRLTRPDGSVAVDQSYPSDSQGNFEFTFETRNEQNGTYQLTVTSHCLESHRYACTYKNVTLPIHLKNP